MWVLYKVRDTAFQYLISSKKCYSVGRKNVHNPVKDITLDDPSISRFHCVINVAAKRDCPFTVETHTGVWVIDKKSKYGTYTWKDHVWVRLDEGEIEELPTGRLIRFGMMQNVWRVEYKPVIACTSRLSTQQAQQLKSHLATVDGKILNKWTDQCTLVIVNDITLTIKVLLALVNGIPIVTTDYVKQLVQNVLQNQPLPDYAQYRPKITESTLVSHLVSLNPDDNRKELFKGKTFVLPREEQLETLREIIEAAGGCVELLKLGENWRKLSDENTIVVQLPCNSLINPDKSAQSFKNLARVLKNEYNVRVVPETEIYHAIAYSSIEKYCNPKSNEFELRHSSDHRNSCGDVIEEETPAQCLEEEDLQQPTTSGIKEGSRLLCAASEGVVTASRKRCHSPEMEISSKKPALVNNKDSDDDDMICDSGNEEPDKPAEETAKTNTISNNFENLTIEASVSAKDGAADDASKKSAVIPPVIDPDDDSDDFWNWEPGQSTCEESGKRKLSTDESEFDRCEKRKCVDVTKKPEEIPPSSPVEKEITVKMPMLWKKPKHLDYTKFGEPDMWYLRKNADPSRREKTDPPVIVNVKRFKKKERYVPKVEYSEERTKEIGKMLLMQGWHLSRCGRMKAAAAAAAAANKESALDTVKEDNF